MAGSGAKDPFAALGLPPSFALASEVLDAKYHELARQTHPDRFAQAPAAQRVAALQSSMTYNEAYKTLRKPASRAEALLASVGIVIGEHERLDAAMLTEVLSWREELADATAAGALAAVSALERGMKQKEAALLAALATSMEAGEAAAAKGDLAARDGHFAAAKQTLIVLRYVARYLEECDAAITALDDA